MSRPRPKVEYRIRCASYDQEHDLRAEHRVHRFHQYPKASLERAQTAAHKDNIDPVMRFHPGCVPWTVEARVVTPWEPYGDAEELAAMLEADWWDDTCIETVVVQGSLL